MRTAIRTAVATTVTCLALLTTAAPSHSADAVTAPPAECGAEGMPTCQFTPGALCIVPLGPFVLIVVNACDWENEGCGPA